MSIDRELFAEPEGTPFFGGRQSDAAAAPVAIFGIPYDLGNPVAPGAREAPARIRARSADLEPPAGDLADLGDLRFAYGENPAAIFDRLGGAVQALVDGGVFALAVGGDHSVSYPLVVPLQRREEIAVVWLDAHTDYNGWSGRGAHDHKQVLRRIAGLPGVRRVVVPGHRGFTPDSELELGEPARVLRPADLRPGGPEALLAELPPELPVYVSLDVDVLDPAFAPGTSTPVPGGLTPTELDEILAALFRERQVRGMDLVEVNPSRDPDGRTVGLAAGLLRQAVSERIAAS
jgi:agmatinase